MVTNKDGVNRYPKSGFRADIVHIIKHLMSLLQNQQKSCAIVI